MSVSMLLKWLIRKDREHSEDPGSTASTSSTSSSSSAKISDKTPPSAADESENGANECSFCESEEPVQEKVGAVTGADEGSQIGTAVDPLLELCWPQSKHCIRQLALLNAMCLPLNCGDWTSPHYRSVARNELAKQGPTATEESEEFWTRMAYFRRTSLVGAITACSHHCPTDGEGGHKLHIHLVTLAVLPTFRRRGVATRLLQELLEQCKKWPNVEKIFLHCQTCNETALALYRRHGFVEAELIPDYYKGSKIASPDAYRLELDIRRAN